ALLAFLGRPLLLAPPPRPRPRRGAVRLRADGGQRTDARRPFRSDASAMVEAGDHFAPAPLRSIFDSAMPRKYCRTLRSMTPAEPSSMLVRTLNPVSGFSR